jgi:hypothetical protein
MVTETKTKEVTIVTRDPHARQLEFIESTAKRKIIRAGRRSGKTVGIAIADVESFIEGKRVLYAAPTGEQTDRYWYEVTRALRPLVETGVYKQNEQERYIEKVNTENRIKAKTAWNANTLRGDYADKLTFDEWQLTAEDAWDEVGAPMLLDNNGDAVFIYTPPSLKSSGISRARDPQHASKMFKRAQEDTTGRWAAFHFTSFDNPHLSQEALSEITQDMSRDSYLKEIMAQDDESEANLLVYGCFNEGVCKIPRFQINKEWPVYTGHDFGSANPAALFVAQDPGTGFFYCFKEYLPLKGKSTFENVQEFKKMAILPDELGKDKPGLYSIRQRIGGNQNSEDEIRQGYAVQGWPIAAPYIEKPKAQIDRVKQLMEKNKIFIFSDMHHLLEEVNTCMWKLDAYGQRTDEIRDEKRYHLLACVRCLFSIFRPETEERRPSRGVPVVGINW